MPLERAASHDQGWSRPFPPKRSGKKNCSLATVAMATAASVSRALWHLREQVRSTDSSETAKARKSLPDHVGAERDDVLHDRRNVQPDSDLRDRTAQIFSTKHTNHASGPLNSEPARRTHVGDDGDEGVGDGEGQALRVACLEALLHQREPLLPAKQADVAQQMQRDLHVLGKQRQQDRQHPEPCSRTLSQNPHFPNPEPVPHYNIPLILRGQ